LRHLTFVGKKLNTLTITMAKCLRAQCSEDAAQKLDLKHYLSGAPSCRTVLNLLATVVTNRLTSFSRSKCRKFLRIMSLKCVFVPGQPTVKL
jgi:hypothetical protein